MGAKIEKRINPTREINTDAPEIRSICIYTVSKKYSCYEMVSPTTKQVETFFGELEYIEPRLKALGVTLANEEADRA